MKTIPAKIVLRKDEITESFLKEIDNHLLDIIESKTEEMLEINDFAKILFIHPTHLSNTIKLATGKSPCDFYEEKIIAIAKKLLENPEYSISQIAMLLTYDPSNFTKFFKKYTGVTPTSFRKSLLSK